VTGYEPCLLAVTSRDDELSSRLASAPRLGAQFCSSFSRVDSFSPVVWVCFRDASYIRLALPVANSSIYIIPVESTSIISLLYRLLMLPRPIHRLLRRVSTARLTSGHHRLFARFSWSRIRRENAPWLLLRHQSLRYFHRGIPRANLYGRKPRTDPPHSFLFGKSAYVVHLSYRVSLLDEGPGVIIRPDIEIADHSLS
jgi:hypothetical protein